MEAALGSDGMGGSPAAVPDARPLLLQRWCVPCWSALQLLGPQSRAARNCRYNDHVIGRARRRGQVADTPSAGRLVASVSNPRNAGLTVGVPLADREDRVHDHTWSVSLNVPQSNLDSSYDMQSVLQYPRSVIVSGTLNPSPAGFLLHNCLYASTQALRSRSLFAVERSATSIQHSSRRALLAGGRPASTAGFLYRRQARVRSPSSTWSMLSESPSVTSLSHSNSLLTPTTSPPITPSRSAPAMQQLQKFLLRVDTRSTPLLVVCREEATDLHEIYTSGFITNRCS